ncbi:hypothetical protein [Agromyces archimandritae]|uniref:Uncharacterized protein n=1 Tax=Agromyces archimandritae TaxID=2781962 RepID=A0A975FKE0_9MICO|nr:hypothetical protein [Agromyces archimandritae]QTX03377.1 hypothetical protein G127AT_08270 [Agromyces archimandritae]
MSAGAVSAGVTAAQASQAKAHRARNGQPPPRRARSGGEPRIHPHGLQMRWLLNPDAVDMPAIVGRTMDELLERLAPAE